MLYKKKSTMVEACRPYHDESSPEWFSNALDDGRITLVKGRGFYIETLEGTMHASPDDFIIKGVKGEIYPCKPDIFYETYEEVRPNNEEHFTDEKPLKVQVSDSDHVWVNGRQFVSLERFAMVRKETSEELLCLNDRVKELSDKLDAVKTLIKVDEI